MHSIELALKTNFFHPFSHHLAHPSPILSPKSLDLAILSFHSMLEHNVSEHDAGTLLYVHFIRVLPSCILIWLKVMLLMNPPLPVSLLHVTWSKQSHNILTVFTAQMPDAKGSDLIHIVSMPRCEIRTTHEVNLILVWLHGILLGKQDLEKCFHSVLLVVVLQNPPLFSNIISVTTLLKNKHA